MNTHLLWTGAGRAPCKAVLAVSALPNKLWHALKITHTQKKQHMTSFCFTTITHLSAQVKSEFKFKKKKNVKQSGRKLSARLSDLQGPEKSSPAFR